jgi:molybdate transport system substrate-binding protein
MGSVGAKLSCCVVVAALLPVLFGCGGSGGSEGSGESALTVFAASSLTDAFGELKDNFEEENSGTEVALNFAGSSTLLTQLEQGAPADVFASADEAKMDAAIRDGLAEAPQTFARNRLTVIVAAGNPAGIESYRDLARPGITLVLAQDEVPVAQYAKESLTKANAVYGSDFSERMLSNVASREADVKAAANRVAVGDADATIVYTSDATPSLRERVETIEIPEELNVVATYPITVLEGAQSPELAQQWVDLVLSDEGQRVLESYGFERAN